MLADILPKIAAETQKQEPYRPRPSLAGPERCLRQLVYMATNTKSAPLPGRAMLIFDDSSWHEELTKDWIRKSGYQLHSEQMSVDTTVGSGKIDGIITDLLERDRLLEHKAINHFTFERIWKGQWPLDNITQTILYLVGVKKLNPDITEALLLIKNKNTSQYIELLLAYDEAQDQVVIVEVVRSDGQIIRPSFVLNRVTQSAVEKFREVQAHVSAGTLPPRPFEYGTEFPCGYCRFAKTCWEGYQEEFQDLATDQELDQELVDAAAYDCELRGHIDELESQRKEVREKIKSAFDAKGIRHGRTSEYAITLAMREKVSFDESAIPPDILTLAKHKTAYLQLDVRKLKKKEAANGH